MRSFFLTPLLFLPPPLFCKRFYASWCKSCQRFGEKFRHLAFEEGDHINIGGSITKTGNVRFAEIEYSANAKLCKLLKVRKLPTVHMYRKGRGKIADMCCKPSQFHVVIDEMNRLRDDPGAAGEASSSETVLESNGKTTSNDAGDKNAPDDSFDKTLAAGSTLADEIMSSLRKEEGDKKGSKKEKIVTNQWFPFKF